jgi:hypothetical protein
MWPRKMPVRPAHLPLSPPLFDREIPAEWAGFAAEFVE